MSNKDSADSPAGSSEEPAASEMEVRKPAQIPLLDDVVDDTANRPPPRRPRQRHTRAPPADMPQSRDLFGADPGEDPADPDSGYWSAGGNDDLPEPGQQGEPVADCAPPADGGVDDTPIADRREDAARQALRARAGRMVDDLVAELSPAIIDRLRSELTEQLTSVLEDLTLDTDQRRHNRTDDDTPADSHEHDQPDDEAPG